MMKTQPKFIFYSITLQQIYYNQNYNEFHLHTISQTIECILKYKPEDPIVFFTNLHKTRKKKFQLARCERFII